MMIHNKSIALALLASLFLTSSMAVNALVPADTTRQDVPASSISTSHLRKGSAATVPDNPARDRDLVDASSTSANVRTCFQVKEDGVAALSSCSIVGACAVDVCCGSMETCHGLGQFWCKTSSGFAIDYADEVLCPYKWSCCY